MKADDKEVDSASLSLGDRITVCGISWGSGLAEGRVRISGAPSRFVPLTGLRIGYDASSAKIQCVGHKPFRDRSAPWVDCDNAPLHGGRKCDRCTANDAAFASQLHHAHTRGVGELDASVQTHLAQQHHLYLAAFRDGSIKVGTSTSPRLHTRLAEQGAWRAEIVATATDGVAIRLIEDAVTSELGIAQSVSARRKLRGLADPIADEALERELTRWASAVHVLIDEFGSDQITPTTEAWVSPVSADPTWSNVLEYPLDLRTGNHALNIVGVCGRLMAFQRPGVDDIFIADLRRLYGFEVELADVQPDELSVQDSLF